MGVLTTEVVFSAMKEDEITLGERVDRQEIPSLHPGHSAAQRLGEEKGPARVRNRAMKTGRCGSQNCIQEEKVINC